MSRASKATLARDNFKKAIILPFFVVVLIHEIIADVQRMQEPECPGTCTTLMACKSTGGKVIGFCMDGKMCCGGAGGFNIIPTTASCGASIMSRKVALFQSPNYPGYSGGNMICEFTLQLNPPTVGIRLANHLNLPTVPTNPLNFFESPNPVCDSDFMMIRGFGGWSPDFRCGNLTGYSFMVERENGQPTLSTVFIMASNKYRWNIQFTEVFYNEVESLDYILRNPISNQHNSKKQWIWYPPPPGAGMTIQLSPPGPPPLDPGQPGPFPPSMLIPPSQWQYYQPLMANRNAMVEDTSEVEILNTTNTDTISGVSTTDNSDDSGNLHPFSRIVGGTDAKPNSVPWQVSLQLIPKMESGICGTVKNLSSHFCGGSIIGDRTILTASHCFLSSSRFSHTLLPASRIKVVVGEHDFCSDNEVPSTREYSIERIVLHYNYITTDVINDLATIRVTKPIIFDNNVHAINLPDEHTKMDIFKPLLSGWGSLGVDENSTYPSILQQSSNVHIFSEKECQHFQREFLEYVYPENKLTGKYRGAFDHGICTRATDAVTEAGFGDSGGPLSGISSTGGPPVLLGVVSHMRPHPDPETNLQFHLNFFGKVASYRKWILMNMI